MNLFANFKRVDLLTKAIKGDLEKLVPTDFVPQKLWIDAAKNTGTPLPTITPEQGGIHSVYVESFLQALDKAEPGKLHAVAIARGGNVVTRATWKPYRLDTNHVTHSLCKSLTAMAVGLAYDQGLLKLEEKLVDLFPERVTLLTAKHIRAITIEHLLTMTTGVNFAEVDSIVYTDWVKGYMESDCRFEPGSQFAYNSMNTYMLSAIIRKKTGMGLLDYLQEHLLNHMEIVNLLWEKCPMGIEKGGWGCYIALEDMLKLGLLYAQNGQWNGKQLLSQDWVSRATTPHFPPDNGKGYGYQVWMYGSSYLFNGMFGQYVLVYPKNNVVVAISAGVDNMFPKGPILEVAERYFGDENSFVDKLFDDAVSQKKLQQCIAGLGSLKKQQAAAQNNWLNKLLKPKTDEKTEELIGKIRGNYTFEKPQGALLPVMVQGMQNNFSAGIDRMTIEPCAEGVILRIYEKDVVNAVKVGIDSYLYSRVDIRGESFKIGAGSTFTTDEDDNLVWKVNLCLTEHSSARKFKFFFKPQGLLVKLDETPSMWSIIGQVGDGEMAVPEIAIKTMAIPMENEYGLHYLGHFFAPELVEKKGQ